MKGNRTAHAPAGQPREKFSDETIALLRGDWELRGLRDIPLLMKKYGMSENYVKVIVRYNARHRVLPK